VSPAADTLYGIGHVSFANVCDGESCKRRPWDARRAPLRVADKLTARGAGLLLSRQVVGLRQLLEGAQSEHREKPGGRMVVQVLPAARAALEGDQVAPQ